MTRRVFLWLAALFTWNPFQTLAQRRVTPTPIPAWSVRYATVGDAPHLVEAFRQTSAAGRFPDRRVFEWTLSQARDFLAQYTRSVVVEKDGVPVGVLGIGEWGPPGSGAPWQTSDPNGPDVEVGVIKVDDLGPELSARAVSLMATAAAREFKRAGYNKAQFITGPHNEGLADVISAYTEAVTKVPTTRSGIGDVIQVVVDTDQADRKAREKDPDIELSARDL